MPIILQPIISGDSVGDIVCSDLDIISPSDKEYQACPILNQIRYVGTQAGVCATLNWPVRDRDGNLVNLVSCIGTGSSSLVDDGQLIFRFRNALDDTSVIHQIIGTSPAPSGGIAQVVLTEALVATAGIYRFDVGITTGDGKLQFVDYGFLSVERGSFSSNLHISGPLTMGEIRMELMDYDVANPLLQEVEFHDNQLMQAMIHVIQLWNESPPAVAFFTGANFPFHYHWLKMTVAELLKVAAHWYRRNKLKVVHGGMQDDEFNKDGDYMLAAREIEAEFKQWMRRKKVEINVRQAAGGIGSSYSYTYGR